VPTPYGASCWWVVRAVSDQGTTTLEQADKPGVLWLCGIDEAARGEPVPMVACDA
jgi:hypothetical protein